MARRRREAAPSAPEESARERRRRRARRAAALAALLLLLERRARRGLSYAARLPLSLRALRGASPEHVENALRALGRPTVAAFRRRAREAALDRWAAATGRDPLALGAEVAAIDADRAAAAADGLARNWRKAYESALGSGAGEQEARDEAGRSILSTSVPRTAATETAHALNAETLRQAEAAAARSEEEHAADVLAGRPRVRLVWSAILDMRTCPRCAALDGTSVVLPLAFAEEPPIHPSCRCIVLPELF